MTTDIHPAAPLDALIEEIEHEPMRRRAFWQSLAHHLRDRHARLPHLARARRHHAPPPPPDGDDTEEAPAEAARTEPRPLRLSRLALLVAGLVGSTVYLAGEPDER